MYYVNEVYMVVATTQVVVNEFCPFGIPYALVQDVIPNVHSVILCIIYIYYYIYYVIGLQGTWICKTRRLNQAPGYKECDPRSCEIFI